MVKTFGCRAYVHVPQQRRQNKLSPKATAMVFVGYEPGVKGYRFWDKQRIVLARDAVFDETNFPYRTDISSSKQPEDGDNLPLDIDSPFEDLDEPGHDKPNDGDDDHSGTNEPVQPTRIKKQKPRTSIPQRIQRTVPSDRRPPMDYRRITVSRARSPSCIRLLTE